MEEQQQAGELGSREGGGHGCAQTAWRRRATPLEWLPEGGRLYAAEIQKKETLKIL